MNKERKAWLQNQNITAVLFFVLFIYVFFHTIPSASTPSHTVSVPSSSNPSRVKIYLYPLPRKFTNGVVERYWRARGIFDVANLKYPSHQHSAEWHLLLDLTRDERDRVGSPVMRVSNPEEADLFYVPFFSSLSWVASKIRSLNGSVRSTKPWDAEAQEELVAWLEEQEHWRRSQGRDHVVMCQNPNALRRVKDRIKNAVWVVSDSRRVRPHHLSLAKDVVVPYSHRVSTYHGGIGVEKRKTLLFFVGNRYRPGVTVSI
jgi:hypothetical protein